MPGFWNESRIIKGAYIIVFSLFCFLLFSHLGTLSLRLWDEARNGVNALDMWENGFSIITRYKGNPELWNTKPPLLIWIQAACMKIMGINVLSMRLPSALAGMSIFPLMIYFLRRLKLRHELILLSLSIFICIPLTLHIHCFKTGDYDALLSLFIMVYTMFFYLFLKEGKNTDLWLFTLTCILAGWTKGVAGFLIAPGILALITWKKKWGYLMKNRSFYFSLIIILLGVGGYYVLREYLSPGYLEVLWENELGGRFGPTKNHHIGPFHYYLHFLWTTGLDDLRYLLFFIPFGFMVKNYREISMFSLLAILGHHMIIGLSQTKLYWYCLPEIPFLAMLIGTGIVACIELLKFKGLSPKIMFLSITLVMGIYSYRQVLRVVQVTNFPWEKEQFAISEYIDENIGDPENIEGFLALHKHSSDHTYFYIKKAEQKGIRVGLADYKRLEKGDKVLVAHNGVEEELFKLYDLKHLSSFADGEGQKYVILGVKEE